MAVRNKPAWNQKHKTTDDSRSHGQPVGIDLFDDEVEGFTSIYERFDNGLLYPARTVFMNSRKHAKSVLDAWRSKYGLSTVKDHRTKHKI